MGILSTVAKIKIETGRLLSPFRTEFNGFKVTVGAVDDPAKATRTYEDIKAIVKSNPDNFKIHEERDENDHFKSFTITT